MGQVAALAALAALLPTAAIAGRVAAASPAPAQRPATFTDHVVLNGARLTHPTPKGPKALSQPDDITDLGGHLFVGFQNGVGPQGQPSPTGNLDSTIVEVTGTGHAVHQWDLVGKCDGLTADPATGRVIATVNEDAHSSFYSIDPSGAATHYRYTRPLPSHGGTDAVSFFHGLMLISASAPGTTGKAAPQPSYPAVYEARLDPGTRQVDFHGLFYDTAGVTVANAEGQGSRGHLGLTDPDSNEVVPSWSPRFAGDFLLTSQGDKEQIYVEHPGVRHQQKLWLLRLSDSVDDTAWASTSSGAIYTTDNGRDTINRITGPFQRGQVYSAVTPCDANGAPSTCPGPGFPPDYLGRLDLRTGRLTRVRVSGPGVAPQGMLFQR
ncbi:MAG TPA: hypothetical protein VKV06_13960 [Acidimicrobiales bacterium]|nr:hypothetical protein [Acidimicrobiales bacterium]